MSCNIDELNARPYSDSNFAQACIIKEALLDPSVPTRSLSGLWSDANGKPMVGYFGDSYDMVNAHSVPVSACFGPFIS